MSQRAWLTFAWLLGLAACLVIIEMYFRRTVDGIAYVFEDQRPELLGPIASLYSVHIAGILGSWFVHPFKPPRARRSAEIVFAIALACTLIWNIGAVYLVGQRLVWPEQSGTLVNDLSVAKQFGTLFSFLVAPVNIYYFGIKTSNPTAPS